MAFARQGKGKVRMKMGERGSKEERKKIGGEREKKIEEWQKNRTIKQKTEKGKGETRKKKRRKVPPPKDGETLNPHKSISLLPLNTARFTLADS